MTTPKKPAAGKGTWTLTNVLPWLLLVGGIVGLLSSFILTLEHYSYMKNPTHQAICDLNPVFSCKSVGSSDQASIFGFPNDFIGLAGYAFVATVGLALLAGAHLKRWFWLFLEFALLFAVGIVTWLQFQTIYRIGALCLFCMVIWAVTIPMFWYLTLYNLREGHIKTPASLSRMAAFALRHHGDILLVWFLVIILLIGKRFWYYWSTLF